MPLGWVQRNARDFPALSVDGPTTTEPSVETAVATPAASPGSSVRVYVQNRLLRKTGWSWYEGDC